MSGEAAEIRVATGADVVRIRDVVRAAYALYVPRIGREPAPMTADYGALVAAAETWVATVAGEIGGVLVIRPAGSELLLENVAVDPPLQGRGIGRTLIAFAERWALEHGLEAVTLYTNEAMTENLGLYPALGFVETGRRTEDGYRRVYFRKHLPGLGALDAGGQAG